MNFIKQLLFSNQKVEELFELLHNKKYNKSIKIHSDNSTNNIKSNIKNFITNTRLYKERN